MAEQALVSFECCQAVVLPSSGPHGPGPRSSAQQHLQFPLQHHYDWVQAVDHCWGTQPHHRLLMSTLDS